MVERIFTEEDLKEIEELAKKETHAEVARLLKLTPADFAKIKRENKDVSEAYIRGIKGRIKGFNMRHVSNVTRYYKDPSENNNNDSLYGITSEQAIEKFYALKTKEKERRLYQELREIGKNGL